MKENRPLIANNENLSNSAERTKYQQLASWMSREHWLYQMAFKLSGAPNNHQKPWLLHLDNAAQASQYTTQTLWPMLFFIMQLHDIIAYLAHPEDRYDTSFGQLILGMPAANEQSVSVNFGSTLAPKPAFFWDSTFVLYMGWMITMLAFVTHRRHWDQPQDGPHSAAQASHLLIRQHNLAAPINDINDDGSITFAAPETQQQTQPYHALRDAVTSDNHWAMYRMHLLANIAYQRPNMAQHSQAEIQRIANNQQHAVPRLLLPYYAQYLMWSIGAETFKAKHIPFWLITLYANYAQLRFFMLPLIKLAQYTAFHKAQQQCETANKVWSLMTLAGQYLCTVCGDWSFATLKQANSVQGCATALAEQVDLAPEQLATYLTRLATVSNDPLHVLNLTQQAWHSWTAPELKTVVDSLPNTLTTLDLSAPFEASHLNLDSLQILVAFISQLSLLTLNLSNIALNEGRLTQLMPALIAANPETLTMADCTASEEDLLTIARNLSALSHLKTWDLSGNQVTDDAIRAIVPFLPNNLSQWSLANNQLQSNGLVQIAQWLNHSQAQMMDISGHPLSTDAALALGQALASSPVQTLVIQNMGADDYAWGILASGFAGSRLDTLDLSDNTLDAYRLQQLLPHITHSTISTLLCQGCDIDDDALTALVSILNTSSIRSLSLPDNAFTGQAFVNQPAALPSSTITTLNLADNELDPQVANAMAQAINEQWRPAQLNLANSQWSAAATGALLQAIQPPLHTLVLDGNTIDIQGMQAIQRHLTDPNATLHTLALRLCELNAIELMALLPGLTSGPLRQLYVDHNQNLHAFAQQLATSGMANNVPHRNQLTEQDLSRDQNHAFYHATIDMVLTTISLRDTGLNPQSAMALCRLAQALHAELNIDLASNPASVQRAIACRYQPEQQREQRSQRTMANNHPIGTPEQPLRHRPGLFATTHNNTINNHRYRTITP